MKKKTDINALKAIPLGGHGEIGKNAWIFEQNDEIIIVDFGMILPPQDLTGVDLILPSTNYLLENQEKIKGLILTSAHDDFCGGAFYLLEKVKIPKIWGSKLAIQSVKKSLGKKTILPETEELTSRKQFQIGNNFNITSIQNTSVIPDTYGLFIKTTSGNVLYTGAFKVDQTPYDEVKFDYFAYSEAGEQTVDLLISDSSNVESVGYTQSERFIIKRFNELLDSDSRVIVVTYPNGLHKFQILLDLASKKNRKVCISGEHLNKKIDAAFESGFLKFDKKILIQEKDLAGMNDKEVLVILSGKCGDFLKGLIEIANEQHPSVKLKQKDIVVVSANPPPGTARILAHTVDQLFVQKVQVVGGKGQGVHVSGHSSQEECKFIVTITKPRSFIPSFGEERQMVVYGKHSENMGVNHNDIHILKNGEVVQLRDQVARTAGRISAPAIYYNQAKGLDIDELTMKERQSLSDEGTITIALAVDEDRNIIAGPEILAEACSFAKGKDWRAFCMGTSQFVTQAIADALKKDQKDLLSLKNIVRDTVNKTVIELVGKRPLINVSIQEIVLEKAKKG